MSRIIRFYGFFDYDEKNPLAYSDFEKYNVKKYKLGLPNMTKTAFYGTSFTLISDEEINNIIKLYNILKNERKLSKVGIHTFSFNKLVLENCVFFYLFPVSNDEEIKYINSKNDETDDNVKNVKNSIVWYSYNNWYNYFTTKLRSFYELREISLQTIFKNTRHAILKSCEELPYIYKMDNEDYFRVFFKNQFAKAFSPDYKSGETHIYNVFDIEQSEEVYNMYDYEFKLHVELELNTKASILLTSIISDSSTFYESFAPTSDDEEIYTYSYIEDNNKIIGFLTTHHDTNPQRGFVYDYFIIHKDDMTAFIKLVLKSLPDNCIGIIVRTQNKKCPIIRLADPDYTLISMRHVF